VGVRVNIVFVSDLTFSPFFSGFDEGVLGAVLLCSVQCPLV